MRLFILAMLAALTMASPARAQNQFPDPNLLDPTGVGLFTSPAGALSYGLPTLTFNGGTALYTTAGAVNTALLVAWGVGEIRQIQAYAVHYSAGDLQCRFRGGSYVSLGVAGTGLSAAVAITAGSGSTGLQCRGISGAAMTLQARPSNGDPIFNITP